MLFSYNDLLGFSMRFFLSVFDIRCVIVEGS